MLRDITIGQYLNTDSYVHRLDPRNKIVTLNLFMITLFLMPGILSYFPITVLVVAMIYAGRIPMKNERADAYHLAD